jgi:hypothetical protein
MTRPHQLLSAQTPAWARVHSGLDAAKVAPFQKSVQLEKRPDVAAKSLIVSYHKSILRLHNAERYASGNVLPLMLLSLADWTTVFLVLPSADDHRQTADLPGSADLVKNDPERS